MHVFGMSPLRSFWWMLHKWNVRRVLNIHRYRVRQQSNELMLSWPCYSIVSNVHEWSLFPFAFAMVCREDFIRTGKLLKDISFAGATFDLLEIARSHAAKYSTYKRRKLLKFCQLERFMLYHYLWFHFPSIFSAIIVAIFFNCVEFLFVCMFVFCFVSISATNNKHLTILFGSFFCYETANHFRNGYFEYFKCSHIMNYLSWMTE